MSSHSRSRSQSPDGRNLTRLPAYEPPILPLHQRAMPQLTQDALEIARKDSELLDRARAFLATSASQLGQRSHFAATEKDEMVRILEGLDESAKRLVDYRRKVKDREAVMVEIVREEEQRPRPPEPPEELAPVRVEEGVWGRYSERVRERQKAWDERSEFEKYANDDDYDLFRRIYWDARNPDIPLPSARAWFHVQGGGGGSDSDSDDIQIARQTESYKCPLTQREFSDPVQDPHCGHTFERDAILEMLGNKPNMICPANGCSQNIVRRNLEPNRTIMLKLGRHRATEERKKRQKEMAKGGLGDADYWDHEDEDGAGTRSSPVKIKKESGSGRKKPRGGTVVSVIDDDDE